MKLGHLLGWRRMETSDFDLLDRWRTGEAAAGEELFARYFDSLCGFFATKCFADADELVQRTLLATVRGKDQFRKQASFRTYLFTLARHELYHYLQQRRRDGVLDFSITSIAEIITTPASRLARDAERRRLLDVLRTLPVEQQTLLELHYWEELDSDALAEVFETTPGAIRVRLTRARKLLRDALGADEASIDTVAKAGRPTAD
jgi:RNA polymerase sigma factor (sigma-70 family)